MNTLGDMLVKHAAHCASTRPEACDLLHVTLRGVVTDWIHDQSHLTQILYTGLPLPETTTDLLVLRQGYFREQFDADGELPGIWQPFGRELWIPVDSILLVTFGGAR
jgi:hypothetical protein